MESIQQILGDPKPFLQRIFEQLKSSKIDVADLELDHICYRVATVERYQILKEKLQNIGDLLTENHINGRAIATFKLHKPIVFQKRKIWVLELPAPKAGSNYPEGFEHVEFVISESFEDFMKRYPSAVFDKKGLSKKVNAELRISFGNLSVKFHHQSLEYVIQFLD